MSIPPEILDLIATHWNGRGLLATCRRMWANYNLDAFIINGRIKRELDDGGLCIVETSSFPNGTFHGTSHVITIGHQKCHEIVEYYRGAILRVDEMDEDGDVRRRDILRDGVLFTWIWGNVDCDTTITTYKNIMRHVNLVDFESAVEAWLVAHDDVIDNETPMTQLPLFNGRDILPFTM